MTSHLSERLIHQTLQLFLLTLVFGDTVYMVASTRYHYEYLSHDERQMRSHSQCFHIKGVPTLKLVCPGGDLIRVRQAFYGLPQENKTCTYEAHGDHCIELTDIQQNCMGRYMCSVYVSNPFMMTCRGYANYLQVNYTCVPKTDLYDMCQGGSHIFERGYLKTPHYPDANYTNNLNCRCRLRTADSSLLLHILDFSVNRTMQGVCDSDYLGISGWGKKCGSVGAERLPERLEVDSGETSLDFHSDSKHTSRGFWLEVTGSQGGKVYMTCESYRLPMLTSVIKPSIKKAINNLVQIRAKAKKTPIEKLSVIKEKEKEKARENTVLIDDTNAYPTLHSKKPRINQAQAVERKVSKSKTRRIENHEHFQEEFSDNFNFNDNLETYRQYNTEPVEIATGIVVGVLILTAVIIIIVLVFRR